MAQAPPGCPNRGGTSPARRRPQCRALLAVDPAGQWCQQQQRGGGGGRPLPAPVHVGAAGRGSDGTLGRRRRREGRMPAGLLRSLEPREQPGVAAPEPAAPRCRPHEAAQRQGGGSPLSITPFSLTPMALAHLFHIHPPHTHTPTHTSSSIHTRFPLHTHSRSYVCVSRPLAAWTPPAAC